MRVKVGDTWYDAEPGQPIMVELSPQDRINIHAMAPNASRYALFSAEDNMTIEERTEWMGGLEPRRLADVGPD